MNKEHVNVVIRGAKLGATVALKNIPLYILAGASLHLLLVLIGQAQQNCEESGIVNYEDEHFN